MLSRLRALIGGSRGERSPRRKVPLAEYDTALKAQLKGLPRGIQAAFAAACAERLYPAYSAFQVSSGRDDGGLIRRTLDIAWAGARSGSVEINDPVDLFEQCVALIPGPESEDTIPAHADDAIAATAYALQAAAGLDEWAAGWAAQRLTDSLDNFLLSSVFDLAQPGAEQLVWEHDLVVAEISRRQTDLDRLTAASDWEATVSAVRAEATAASALPLDRLRH